MSGGTPVAGGYMRQRHSQGYASGNEDVDDDACSRLQPLSPATSRSRTWTEILENLLWVASALFIIYFGDRHSNLIYILWHDERIRSSGVCKLSMALDKVLYSICFGEVKVLPSHLQIVAEMHEPLNYFDFEQFMSCNMEYFAPQYRFCFPNIQFVVVHCSALRYCALLCSVADLGFLNPSSSVHTVYGWLGCISSYHD
ncbi:hypothetical protein CCACVL1_23530 [Corchorus capsularis]|uniref:Uncharacterized protein n=1 Tax=Corchorus capsularis TaxID=210143 RepID=A0A1R3GTH0_COCAP|nr:hypothetical protein CCACVL1_23530 [Corchorus capsularis]